MVVLSIFIVAVIKVNVLCCYTFINSVVNSSLNHIYFCQIQIYLVRKISNSSGNFTKKQLEEFEFINKLTLNKKCPATLYRKTPSLL